MYSDHVEDHAAAECSLIHNLNVHFTTLNALGNIRLNCVSKYDANALSSRLHITIKNGILKNGMLYRQHNFKQLNRIISKKLKQISDRTLADKPPCALA